MHNFEYEVQKIAGIESQITDFTSKMSGAEKAEFLKRQRNFYNASAIALTYEDMIRDERASKVEVLAKRKKFDNGLIILFIVIGLIYLLTGVDHIDFLSSDERLAFFVFCGFAFTVLIVSQKIEDASAASRLIEFQSQLTFYDYEKKENLRWIEYESEYRSIKSEDDINNKEITRLYELSVDLEILKHMHA
jgi:hypothetical protein